MTQEATVSDHFLADHRHLKTLLERVVSALLANDTDGAARLWAESCARLALHLESEERHLIPPLLLRSEQDARVVVQEHRHIRARLAELSAAMASHQARAGAIRDFADEFHAHSRSEDRLLYHWTETHLGDSERLAAVEALSGHSGDTEADPA